MSVLATEAPRYLGFIATGQATPRVAVHSLADIAAAWAASFSSATRVVVTP